MASIRSREAFARPRPFFDPVRKCSSTIYAPPLLGTSSPSRRARIFGLVLYQVVPIFQPGSCWCLVCKRSAGSSRRYSRQSLAHLARGRRNHFHSATGILLLLTHLFIEGVSNRRDFKDVQAFACRVKHSSLRYAFECHMCGSRSNNVDPMIPCRIHVARRIPHGLEAVGNACLHVA